MNTKRALLTLLFAFGCTLALLACCFGAVALVNVITIEDINPFLGLFCGLIMVALYPLLPVAGYVVGLGICHFSKNDLRAIWLPLAINAIAVFCFGHLIFTGHAEILSFPGFLQDAYSYLTSQPSEIGMFCMLYAAPCIAVLTYAPYRTFPLSSILRVLLQVFFLLIFVGLGCCWFFSDQFFFLIVWLGIAFTFAGIILFPLLGFFIPKQFAWSLNGRMKPYFPLMYALSLFTLLFGVFMILCLTTLPNYVYEMLKAILPFVRLKYLAPFNDVGGFIIAVYFILLGLIWLISTIIVHCNRCRNCGGYDYEDFSEIGSTSVVTAHVKVVISTLKNIHYYRSGHRREDYDDRAESHERGKTTTKYKDFCRYCKAGFGTSSVTSDFDNTVSTREIGEHSEWYDY